MKIDDKIRDKKSPYDINRKAEKCPCYHKKIDKYAYLRSEKMFGF